MSGIDVYKLWKLGFNDIYTMLHEKDAYRKFWLKLALGDPFCIRSSCECNIHYPLKPRLADVI